MIQDPACAGCGAKIVMPAPAGIQGDQAEIFFAKSSAATGLP
jgi:hypothetical protein